MIRLSVLPLLFALAFAFTSSTPALEVKDARWGFDGKVVSGRFNILSVLVDEPGATPFDGEVSLAETRGSGIILGAPHVQKVYVTPGTQRWIQFTPFLTSDQVAWTIRWGKKGEYEVDKPSIDAPATVILLDPSSPTAVSPKLRGFAEDLFPTSVAATDGLDQLVLDHVPRWDAPRREAFLDWLRGGGVVHLLPGLDGPPTFDGDLAVLNITTPRGRVGSGTVARHEVTRSECDERFLQGAGFPRRAKIEPKSNQLERTVLYDFHQSLLQKLAGMTKPNVQWWLLYLLTIAYLVVIGPVHYRWSRKVDYRVAIGGFLGTVAAFSLAFIFAGSRGAGEIQTAHTVTLAKSLGGKRWDAMQWVSAFATTGNTYRLTHAAPWNLYSAPSDNEAVNGYVLNGKGGYFEVDMPLYSSRPFVHRAVMSGPSSDLDIIEWKADRLVLRPGADFPGDILEMYARRGDKMLTLQKYGGQWEWDEKKNPAPQSTDEFFHPDRLRRFNPDFLSSEFEPYRLSVPLAAVFYGDVEALSGRISRRPLTKDQVQLLLFAKAPKDFAMQGKGFHGEKGWVLYVIDLFQPAS